MNNFNGYFTYLGTRSKLGKLYRKYWLYPSIVSHLKGNTLDVGCGIGDMLAFRPLTTGVDINPHAVDFCKNQGFNAHLMQPDELPFPDNFFDSVLLDNVLEHIEDPNNLLQEIFRVLKEDGTLLIGVPGKRGWLNDPDHKVSYNENSLKYCLSNAGFKCQKVFYAPLWKSSFISKHVSSYCIYALFIQQNSSTKV